MKNIFTYIKNYQLNELQQLIKANNTVLEQRDINQNTPLLLATKLNKKEIISYLLRQNVNINAQNNLGLTALIYAAKNNELSLLKKFLAKDANLKLKSINGIGAVGYAIKYQHYSVFNYLIKLTEPNKKYTKNQELLVKACFNGNLTQTKKLLTKNIDVNFLYYLNFTLLMFAAHSGNKDIVEYLIERGANVNQKNIFNDTALRMATVRNQATVKTLIKHGAIVNHLTINGFSPLMSAILLKKINIIRFLLQKGANPNFGKTEKISLYYKHNKKIFNLLKEFGIKQ